MNYQLIIVLAIMVLPALKQIYDKVQERAEVEKRKRDQTRARTETLRTGRSAPGEQQPAPQRATAPAQSPERTRLQQLEAERERRLRELRRIAQQRAQTTGGAQRQSAPAQQPQQRRPRQRPAVLRPQQAGQRGQGRQQSARRPSVPATPRITRSRPTPSAQAQPAAAPVGIGDGVGAFEGRTIGAPKRRRPGGALGRLGASDLRRAVVLTEVLGKPVALRADHLFTGSDTA